ncbi:MAG: carboxypeptidase-like regulatory domain-containing protein, partial [Bacteroidota bacterium]
MLRLFFLVLVFWLGSVSSLAGQPDLEETKYQLPRRLLPLEKALIKLVDDGARLSYRPDQLPQIAIKVPGGKRTLASWLNFLLKDTELTYQPGPAGLLILPDLNLSSRSYTLYGIVTDAASGERLIGAALQDLQSLDGVLSNEYGFFSLSTSGGQKKLRVSYTGYAPRELAIVLKSDTSLNIALAAASYLPQIEVSAKQDSSSSLFLLQSETRIGREEVQLLNGPGGEASILSRARMLPGITSGADGVGGLVIRGSNSGHNLVLYDGVPVYNINHAAGLFSIFNSAAIRRADVYKDGLPARFGGRIGGVLDVHTRDGNLYYPELTVGSSLLSANFLAEGPLDRGKSSFLVSGRYFWGGGILRDLSAREKRNLGREGNINYAVYDLNVKLNQQIGKKGRLYFSLFSGLDDYGNFAGEQDNVTVLTEGGAVLLYTATQRRAEEISWG